MTLPDAPPAALEHSARLARHIRDEITAAAGWVSFARYMELALYAPGLGYYMAGARKLGRDGDFVTAPDISELFGQTLAARGNPDAAKIMADIPDYHTSPEDAARVADEAGVGELVLYHLVPAPPARLIERVFLGEARDHFDAITLAEDGSHWVADPDDPTDNAGVITLHPAYQPTNSLRISFSEVKSQVAGLSRCYWHVASWEFKGKKGTTGKCTSRALAEECAIAQMRQMGL